MSDRQEPDDLIRNPETRSRRTWVDRALQGVRRRIEAGEPLPEVNEADAPPQPHLYVVPSGRNR